MTQDLNYMTANPKSYKKLKENKKELIINQTDAELILWRLLKNKATGHKIRRQHIIDDFVADFVCLPKKVIIEIDGEIHLQKLEYDNGRTEHLNQLGFEVIRFTNEEVFDNIEHVIEKKTKFLDDMNDK